VNAEDAEHLIATFESAVLEYDRTLFHDSELELLRAREALRDALTASRSLDEGGGR
jgi:hypothetical protein